jgi:hypothetical protein
MFPFVIRSEGGLRRTTGCCMTNMNVEIVLLTERIYGCSACFLRSGGTHPGRFSHKGAPQDLGMDHSVRRALSEKPMSKSG